MKKFFSPFVLFSFRYGDLTGPVYLYVVMSAFGLCSVLLVMFSGNCVKFSMFGKRAKVLR